MISREEYRQYVQEIIEKGNAEVNLTEQMKKYGKANGGLTIIGVLMTFGGFVFTFNGSLFGIMLIILGIILIIVGIVRVSEKSKVINYLNNNYKSKIMYLLLKDNVYTFSENNKIKVDIFLDSQFGDNFDIYDGEDLLSINIPNDDNSKSSTYLNICDLKVIRIEEDDEGNRHEETIYAGAFGYINFPFSFKCALCINTSYRKNGLKWQKVNLEDINFNKKFKIYSDNQIEARYILTPELMDDLLVLNEKIKHLKVTIIDNKMYIGFVGKNLFEFENMRNNDTYTIFEDFYDEIESILKIVNEIKTNNKVFKM